ncbi:hypothetical protein D3C76_1049240 [compost metagenome]
MSGKPTFAQKRCILFNAAKERLTGKWIFRLLFSSLVIFTTQRLGNLFPATFTTPPVLTAPTAMQIVLVAVGLLFSVMLNMAEIQFSRDGWLVSIALQLRAAISYPFPLLLGFCAAFFWQTSSVVFVVYGVVFLLTAALYEVFPLYLAHRCCTSWATS